MAAKARKHRAFVWPILIATGLIGAVYFLVPTGALVCLAVVGVGVAGLGFEARQHLHRVGAEFMTFPM